MEYKYNILNTVVSQISISIIVIKCIGIYFLFFPLTVSMIANLDNCEPISTGSLHTSDNAVLK